MKCFYNKLLFKITLNRLNVAKRARKSPVQAEDYKAGTSTKIQMFGGRQNAIFCARLVADILK